MPILLQVPEFRGCVAHEFIQEFIQYSKIFNLTFYNQILNQFLTFFFICTTIHLIHFGMKSSVLLI